ncbi:hypothetical protein [Nonlabens sp.]|jgi:hypothetical protein|uniref:hypothetical protein n=1 Tax=Nonlabens sp. TaxID=1888209 RepID=UPI0039E4BE57
MFDISREVEIGEYLPEDLQDALCLSLHSVDKLTAASNGDCSRSLVSHIINGTRKVTKNTHPVVLELMLQAKHNSSNMAANGHRIYNIMNEFDYPKLEDSIKKMARDGRY